ncbi:MAG: right-handed parallel beta-helix repeat-containing protein [Xanthobacteraceae bacterium]|nr:right-handed parallel beta-helix repeat-containing protein [Xanthobacteraceae bacterium]
MSGSPITYQPAPGASPVIDATGHNAGIEVHANWVTVSGFEIRGGAQNLTMAQAQAYPPTDTNVNGVGIAVNKWSPAGQLVHVTIQNNTVHDLPGNGIEVGWTDYFTVSGNTVYRNAFWSPNANSGISVGAAWNSDTSTGIKNYVIGNIAWGNWEYLPNAGAGGLFTDGNGIIVDTLTAPYSGRTLVANNLAYKNGGAGIIAFNSVNVDIIFNTAYGNDQNAVNPAGSLDQGQILTNGPSSGINLYNNIMYGVSNYPNAAFGGSASYTADYNILFGGTVKTSGPHDIQADPKFNNPSAGDFTLQSGSPAIRAATGAFDVPADMASKARQAPSDIGAYQYQAPINIQPTKATQSLSLAK